MSRKSDSAIFLCNPPFMLYRRETEDRIVILIWGRTGEGDSAEILKLVELDTQVGGE